MIEGFTNNVLMCDRCHRIFDEVNMYPIWVSGYNTVLFVCSECREEFIHDFMVI